MILGRRVEILNLQRERLPGPKPPAREQVASWDAAVAGRYVKYVKHPTDRIVGRSRALAKAQCAAAVVHDKVGESASSVDGEAQSVSL